MFGVGFSIGCCDGGMGFVDGFSGCYGGGVGFMWVLCWGWYFAWGCVLGGVGVVVWCWCWVVVVLLLWVLGRGCWCCWALCFGWCGGGCVVLVLGGVGRCWVGVGLSWLGCRGWEVGDNTSFLQLFVFYITPRAQNPVYGGSDRGKVVSSTTGCYGCRSKRLLFVAEFLQPACKAGYPCNCASSLIRRWAAFSPFQEDVWISRYTSDVLYSKASFMFMFVFSCVLSTVVCSLGLVFCNLDPFRIV